MKAYAYEVARDLIKGVIIFIVMGLMSASGIWWWVGNTETGQAIIATIELVQTITIEIQQVNGGLTETIRLLNENLERGIEYYEGQLEQ